MLKTINQMNRLKKNAYMVINDLHKNIIINLYELFKNDAIALYIFPKIPQD